MLISTAGVALQLVNKNKQKERLNKSLFYNFSYIKREEIEMKRRGKNYI